MKLKTIHSLIGVSLLSTAFMTAQAAGTGMYVGAGAGQSYMPKVCESNSTEGLTCDNKDISWKLYGGYQINPMFGVELFYDDFGKYKISGSNKSIVEGNAEGNAEGKLSGFGGALTGTWPINQQVALYGKGGLIYWKADVSASETITTAGSTQTKSSSESINGTNFMAGAGVKYSFNENLSLRLEWEFFNSIGKDDDKKIDGTDIHLFSAGITYSF